MVIRTEEKHEMRPKTAEGRKDLFLYKRHHGIIEEFGERVLTICEKFTSRDFFAIPSDVFKKKNVVKISHLFGKIKTSKLF